MKRTHVVAALGLIVAVAIVAPALGGSSLKKLVKKEVAKQVKKLPGAPAGAAGASGAAGSARAYARVTHDCDAISGVCDVQMSKGVAGAVRPVGDTGTYCIDVPGISSAQVPAQVTVDNAHSGGTGNEPDAFAYDETLGSCTAGQFIVVTYIGASPSNNVSFNFLIP